MGGGRQRDATAVLHASIAHASRSPSSPRRPPSFLRRQEPPHTPLPPTPATLTIEQECRTMPLSPQHRRARIPGNHSRANADQNVTEVDTRLTKVDKGCQKLTPSTPAVNPSGASRTTLNNPEQIRTNLNTAKPPDQIETPSRSPRIRPIKTTPNKPSLCLRRNDGIANVPQSARAAIGVWPVTSSRSHWSMVSGEMSVRRARTARVSRPSVGDGWSARGAGQWRKR